MAGCKSLTWPELRSGLILLAMTFIALPLVPDDPVGPFGGVNPREIWLIAIVLAGVSFLGYAAVKYFGERHGVLLAAAAGGLVSSTAVTLANARRAATGEGSPQLLAAGVSLATAVSFVRVLAIVARAQPSLLVAVGPPLAAATIVAVGLALFWVYWRADSAGDRRTVKLRNPVRLLVGDRTGAGHGRHHPGRALSRTIFRLGRRRHRCGGARAVRRRCGDGVDDAAGAAAARASAIGAFAILAAVASNTLSKLVIGAGLGRGRFALDIALMSAVAAPPRLAALWPALLFAPVG